MKRLVKILIGFLMFIQYPLLSQSIVDIASVKIHGNVHEVYTHSFIDIAMDSMGYPIIEGPPMSTVKTTIENGWPVEIRTHLEGQSRDRMKMTLAYEGENLVKVKLFSNYGTKMKMWKWYEMFYDNNVLTHENIYYDQSELRASVKYHYAVNERGNKTCSVDMFKPDEEGVYGNYFFEYDQEDRIIYKQSTVGKDTGMIFRLKHFEDDTLTITTTERTFGGYGSERFPSELTTKLLRDDYGNIFSMYTLLKAIDPKTKDTIFHNSLHYSEIFYNEEEYPSRINLGELKGQYQNEKLRCIMNLGENGICSFTKIPIDGDESEKPADEKDWLYMLFGKEQYSYDEELGILHIDGILEEGIKVRSIGLAIVLTPVKAGYNELYFPIRK